MYTCVCVCALHTTHQTKGFFCTLKTWEEQRAHLHPSASRVLPSFIPSALERFFTLLKPSCTGTSLAFTPISIRLYVLPCFKDYFWKYDVKKGRKTHTHKHTKGQFSIVTCFYFNVSWHRHTVLWFRRRLPALSGIFSVTRLFPFRPKQHSFMFRFCYICWFQSGFFYLIWTTSCVERMTKTIVFVNGRRRRS